MTPDDPRIEPVVAMIAEGLSFVDPSDEDEVDLIRDVVKAVAGAGLLLPPGGTTETERAGHFDEFTGRSCLRCGLDEEFRIRRNHGDEWAKLDAKFARLARFLPPVSYWLRFWLWVLAIVAAVLVLVWIGGAR